MAIGTSLPPPARSHGESGGGADGRSCLSESQETFWMTSRKRTATLAETSPKAKQRLRRSPGRSINGRGILRGPTTCLKNVKGRAPNPASTCRRRGSPPPSAGEVLGVSPPSLPPGPLAAKRASSDRYGAGRSHKDAILHPRLNHAVGDGKRDGGGRKMSLPRATLLHCDIGTTEDSR